MNELATVNFHGNKIAVVEKNGNQYVAMKPIVEAMGLEWNKQLELIKRDPVLNSTMTVTGIVAEDGKVREMICLPLNKLNGWLFKIPANRYSGKRRESIIKYQEECYDVLYDYFHKGAAVNANFPSSEVLMATLYTEMDKRIRAEARADEYYQNLQRIAFASNLTFGELSQLTGLPKDIVVAPHCKSAKRPHQPQYSRYVQLVLPLQDLIDECRKRLNPPNG